MWLGLLLLAALVVVIGVALAARCTSGAFTASSGPSPGAAESLMPGELVETRMDIEYERGIVVIRPSGSLASFEEANALLVAADGLLKSGSRSLVLELDRVGLITPIGLGALLRLSRSCEERDGRVKLCSLSPRLLSVFEITKLNRVLEIFADRHAAVASLTPIQCQD
jgi:anti-sigma B factor antagonist